MDIRSRVYEELSKFSIQNFIGAWPSIYGFGITDHEVLKVMKDLAYNNKELSYSVTDMYSFDMECKVCQSNSETHTTLMLNLFYIANENPDYVRVKGNIFNVYHKKIPDHKAEDGLPIRGLSINICTYGHWFITDEEVEDVDKHIEAQLPF